MISILIASIIIALGSLLLYFLDPMLAKGFAIGGFASLAGLWILYRQTRSIIFNNPTDIHIHFMKGALIRLPIYGTAFYFAHSLDPGTNHALFAALGGYFTTRAIIMYSAIRQSKN